MHGLQIAVLSALLGAALSIPHPHYKRASSALAREFDAPTPPAPAPTIGCKLHINQTDCSSDKCCSWCGPKMAPTVVPIGWCMPVLPVATSLVCDKVPSSCAINLVNTTCIDNCKWIPTSPLDPTGAGICMYDWDACKAPPATPAPTIPTLHINKKQAVRKSAAIEKLATKHAKSLKAPVPPAPKLNCTLATSEECDASKCCQWCGSAFNTTLPGWCMPVLDEPIPMMTCSKGSQSCSSLPAAVCNVSNTCSWMPFGPPTSPMGVCIYDWKKCTAPPPP
mmetsp:Transcript_60291/g.88303  ORF Transcript_60291/g.88303 Transcript_60291/m.88303 type:complete len:279 (-) Transcript_60291:27-863(-)